VRYHGAVKFKVLKSLRHRRARARSPPPAWRFRPVVRLVDRAVRRVGDAVRRETALRQIRER
jgi:hypothetical protein